MAENETTSNCIGTFNTKNEDIVEFGSTNDISSVFLKAHKEEPEDCNDSDNLKQSPSKCDEDEHNEGESGSDLPLIKECADLSNNKVEKEEPVPGSSNESVKHESPENHTVWLNSTKIKTESEDNDSNFPDSGEDEESEEELGEEERLEEDSASEMDDESNGGAYHLAEVSYGEENEDSQKGETETILGMSHDHFISADISMNMPPKNVSSDKNKESNVNGKMKQSQEDSHIFVHTVILKKAVSILDEKGEIKEVKHFKCPHCKYKSLDKRKVVEHTYKHQGLKPYRCPECQLSFSYASYLREHRRITHLKTPFDCKLCGRKCGKQSALDKHLRVHTGEKPFACNFCDYRSTQQNHIKVHIRQHTGEKPYTCKLCDYKCAYSALLKRHMHSHIGEKLFSCVFCDYTTKTNDSLKAHVKKHSNVKAFSCDHCTKSFYTRDAVKRHIKNIHIHNEFKCEYCDISFKREIVFKMHMDEHNNGEKRYSCDLCEYKCAYKLMLNKHMLSHTAESQFAAPMMSTVVKDISANASNNLQPFSNQQPEKMMFNCNHCPKEFKSKLSLKNHLRYMHFPNQYVCNVCILTFKRRTSLKLHMTEHLKMFVNNTKELSSVSN